MAQWLVLLAIMGLSPLHLRGGFFGFGGGGVKEEMVLLIVDPLFLYHRPQKFLINLIYFANYP